MSQPAAAGALQGIRIVDLSRVVAGPLCTQLLADHGAEVVKVEPPDGDETRQLGPPFDAEGSAAYFRGLNRNKRAIALDLRQDAARAVLLRLLEGADVLVENFLPGTLEKWGLGYAQTLAPRFPRLVHCSISGFGADGPRGGRPGYDAVLQAMSGVMSATGSAATGPTRVGVPIVDLTTGLNATIAILLALAERERSGRGQQVEVTLYDSALGLMHPHAASWLMAGTQPTPTGNAHPTISPYDTYRAADGLLFLGVVNDGQYRRFCSVIGREDLAQDPRFATAKDRLAHRPALRAAIEAETGKRPMEALCDALMAAGVPAGPVRSTPQALDDPHTRHRGMLVEHGDYRGLGPVQKLARTPGSVRRAPPAFAADTRAVLETLGYTAAEIDALVRAGAAPDRRRKSG